MRRKFVAGNWKMNGSLAGNEQLVRGVLAGLGELTGVDVAVCVPAPYLAQVAELLRGSPVGLGAQDVSQHASGAYTGDVSVTMLKEFGVRYVICGHSERRAYHHETDSVVARKVEAVLEGGLTPILCLGETLEEREANATADVVREQLDAVLHHLSVAAFRRIVIAYEPVWAIGTGRTATPEQAQEVHALIRARIAEQDVDVASGVIIQYGGSMKPDNAADLMSRQDIDGGLIGGASLKADDFLAICRAGGN